MKESFFGGGGKPEGLENERHFTTDEIINVIHELDNKSGLVKVQNQSITSDGVLETALFRSESNAKGYTYMLKGDHGPDGGSMYSMITRIDYADLESDEVEYEQIIAEYKGGKWIKQ